MNLIDNILQSLTPFDLERLHGIGYRQRSVSESNNSCVMKSPLSPKQVNNKNASAAKSPISLQAVKEIASENEMSIIDLNLLVDHPTYKSTSNDEDSTLGPIDVDDDDDEDEEDDDNISIDIATENEEDHDGDDIHHLNRLQLMPNVNSHPIYGNDLNSAKEAMRGNINELCDWMKRQIDEYRFNMNTLFDTIDIPDSIELLNDDSKSNNGDHIGGSGPPPNTPFEPMYDGYNPKNTTLHPPMSPHMNIIDGSDCSYGQNFIFEHLKQSLQTNIDEMKSRFTQLLTECNLMENIEILNEDDLEFSPSPMPSDFGGAWSDIYKGKNMILSDNNSLVTCKKAFKSIRFDHGVHLGQILEVKYLLYCTRNTGNFIGVTTSKSQISHFNKRATDDSGIQDCYGIDTCSNRIYYGSENRFIETNYDKGKPEMPFNDDKECIITMIVNYARSDNTFLTFYFNDNENPDYAMILPQIDGNQQWFPSISLSRPNSWCQILQTQLV